VKREGRAVEGGGFAAIDEKGRFALPKAVRSELGIEPGGSVAWLVVGGTVVLVPQDQYLAELSAQAQRTLAAAGLSADRIVDELSAARSHVIEELYGSDFVDELAKAEAAPASDALPE